jgi:hypothetical protein
MELKHNIEMYHNDVTQSNLAIKNKDSVIEQLRNQINEMNEEIEERMNDLKIYEENNQMRIQEYNDKIQELIEEKKYLEIQNAELSENLMKANNTLKEYNDVIINKYQNMEEDLNREKNDRIHWEQKYKKNLKEYKNKNSYLIKENYRLKNTLQKYRNDTLFNLQKNNYQNDKIRNLYGFNDIKNKTLDAQRNNLLNVDNYLNKTMFYNTDRNYIFNEDEIIPNNNLFYDVNLTYQNIPTNHIINLKKINNSNTKSNNYFDENKSQNPNNKTINEFKDLLSI